jgi:hypothetical protein
VCNLQLPIHTDPLLNLTAEGAEFHTFKQKEEQNYRVVLKHMHSQSTLMTSKQKLKSLVIRLQTFGTSNNFGPSYHSPCFFVELKPALNNKDIFNVEILQQCKITFEPPRHKLEIAQCSNCQRYGHTKNYCRLQPHCVKCPGDHLTLHCQRKDLSSAVRCVLCDGNHPANYKGCTVYKDLQRKTYPSFRLKQYTPPALIHQILHNQPGVSYAQITSKDLPPSPSPAPAPPANLPLQQFNDISDLKNLFEQMGTMMNLLTTVLTKLK